MNIFKSLISSVVAVALLAAPAQAGPLAGSRAASVEIGGSAIELVGGGPRRHRHRHRHGSDAGAAIAVGAAALIVGAAIAANSRDCWVERSKTWSNRRHAYVVVERTVCD